MSGEGQDFWTMPPAVPPEQLADWLRDVAAGNWAWVRNSKCKYVTLKIDTRRGAFRIEDRDGKPISFDDLTFQYGTRAKETPHDR